METVTTCPFCGKLLKRNGIGSHIQSCPKKIGETRDETYFEYLKLVFPEICDKNVLINLYEKELCSLPDLKKRFNLGFRATTFLLRHFGIKERGMKESWEKISKDKYQKTCLERYGVKNSMSIGTKFIEKRRETIKRKYGSDNIFSSEWFLNYIKTDEPYLKKSGITKNECLSKRSIAVWKNKTDDERNEWLDKSIRSDISRANNIKDVTSKLELTIQNLLNRMSLSYTWQFKIKTSQNCYRYYDFLLCDYKVLIEVNGDYWHANPLKYKADDLISYRDGKKYARQIWEKDKEKHALALKNGYKIIYIWETEMKKKSDEEIINVLITKLKEIYNENSENNCDK